MAEQLDSTVTPAAPVKTSVKVITLVLGILGALATLCGIAVAILYAVIPASVVPPGTPVAQMRLGGYIISGVITVPGIVLIIVGLCLWFFLWRKKQPEKTSTKTDL